MVVDVQQVGAQPHFDDVIAGRVEAMRERNGRLFAGRDVDVGFLGPLAVDVHSSADDDCGAALPKLRSWAEKVASRAVVTNGSRSRQLRDRQVFAAALPQIDHDQRRPRCASRARQLAVVWPTAHLLQLGQPGVAAQIGEKIDLLARQPRAVGRLEKLFDLRQAWPADRRRRAAA